MVAQISTGGNMFGALAYNQNKVDSEEAKVLFSNRMLLSEDGNFSIGECMRSFEMQMPVQLSSRRTAPQTSGSRYLPPCRNSK